MRDLYLINDKRRCSGIQNKMRERNPTDYDRDSSVFLRRSTIIRTKALTKYADRRPKETKTKKPDHKPKIAVPTSRPSGGLAGLVNRSINRLSTMQEPAFYEQPKEYAAPQQVDYFGMDISNLLYKNKKVA